MALGAPFLLVGGIKSHSNQSKLSWAGIMMIETQNNNYA